MGCEQRALRAVAGQREHDDWRWRLGLLRSRMRVKPSLPQRINHRQKRKAVEIGVYDHDFSSSKILNNSFPVGNINKCAAAMPKKGEVAVNADL